MSPWIILLSGPTSSGKTSLAESLQQRLSTRRRPFLHIEADQFGMPHVPTEWDQTKEQSRFNRAFRQSASAYAEEGYDLIIDGILPYGDPDDLIDALGQYRAFRLCYVGVRCDLRTLENLVSARSDRGLDFARQQFQNLHEGQTYDVEVDTTNRTPDEAAEIIAQFIESQDQ